MYCCCIYYCIVRTVSRAGTNSLGLDRQLYTESRCDLRQCKYTDAFAVRGTVGPSVQLISAQLQLMHRAQKTDASGCYNYPGKRPDVEQPAARGSGLRKAADAVWQILRVLAYKLSYGKKHNLIVG